MADKIQGVNAPPSELSSKDEDRVSVASNWKLVWWRFRKNRLAVASALVLLMFYAVVLVPDFFSNQDPEATEAFLAFIPMQGISFFDKNGFNPSVPDVVGKRNPVTLRMGWVPDETVRIPIALFVRGYKYKVLGLVETAIVGLGGSTYRDAVAFAVLILILLLRPNGLLGKKQAEKV